MIFGPDGKPLCESLGDGEEGILKADVDLRDIDYPKAFIDVVGHCKKIRLGPRTRILFAPRFRKSHSEIYHGVECLKITRRCRM